MSRQIAAEFPFVERFAEVSAGLPGADIDWLDALRRESMDRFNALALPSTRVEEWKYTNLNELAGTPFEIGRQSHNLSAADLDGLEETGVPSDGQGPRLLFVNGIHDASRSSVGDLPDGVTVTSFAEALTTHRDLIQPHMERISSLEGDALLALNTAFAMNGFVVVIGEGVEIDQPIELVFVGRTQAPASIHPRNLIVAGADSRVTLIERHIGLDASEYWSNPVTEVVVAPGATVTHRKVQLESPSAFHLARTRVSLAERSGYRCFLMSLGGRLARNEIEVKLGGEGADCQLDGVYLARGKQHTDITTRITHAEPGGTSRQVFKGVLDDRSHGVFQGQVSVSPDAQRTDGHQLNKTLLLSDDAEIDTKPELEIYADDVKCSHGATAGQLDEMELFYLRSRGLDIDEAREVLIRAFVAEVVDAVEDDAFRADVAGLIDGWLAEREVRHEEEAAT